MLQHSAGVSHGANFHTGPFAQFSLSEPSRSEELRMFNKETEEAIDDALNGTNLIGPFYTVEELFEDLNRNLDVDD